MFEISSRVRVNETYDAPTEHGRTGTVVGVYNGFIMVDMDSGNVFENMAELYLEMELDLLDADDDTRL